MKVLAVEANVVNAPTPDELWDEISRLSEGMRSVMEMADINQRPGIAGTRAVYKALGKEPNRYRPSMEAMSRRIIKGMELYRIDTLVDLINLVSLSSGYAIGGFDADKIDGDELTLGVGREGEPFNAIGRGPLNIACLPVYRDATGGIGTPTSDEERTKISLGTRRLLMTINIYREEMPVADVENLFSRLLSRYASATDLTFTIFQ
jgi:DNA/RNA-binding domain of Phe-tRNA-synthetase-like protein